jgi:hypothetical protein
LILLDLGKEGDLPIIYLSVLNTFLKQIGEDAVKEKGYKCFMKYLKKFNENDDF